MSKSAQKQRCCRHTFVRMSIKGTLLCIPKDAIQFEQRKLFLENNQYQILSASTDQDASPLLMERRIDAIVIECTNDSAMARKLKQIAPRCPCRCGREQPRHSCPRRGFNRRTGGQFRWPSVPVGYSPFRAGSEAAAVLQWRAQKHQEHSPALCE